MSAVRPSPPIILHRTARRKGKKQLINYLSFREAEGGGEFRFASDGDVPRVVKLFFQFQPLVVTVDDAVFVFGARFACNINKRKTIL
jgi:hypothetical protein